MDRSDTPLARTSDSGSTTGILTALHPGQPILFGGNRVAYVSEALANEFAAGDRLVVVQSTGDLLRIPHDQSMLVDQAVRTAYEAFAELQACSSEQVTSFFEAFASALENPDVVDQVRAANAADIVTARQRQRSTTRLEFTDAMHRQMIDGLRIWKQTAADANSPVATHHHQGWTVESFRAPLGVVGFVFEGRPNVFADAVGVLRTGNTVVFRIGSDALGTARALMDHAVRPSLISAGLPQGAAVLVDSVERSSGLALCSDARLSLAVARGSGEAVAQLGAVARQSGVPVSLHGTGGAWMLGTSHSDPDRLRVSLKNSLDRKVCNTTNVVCVTRNSATVLMPLVLEAVGGAATQLGESARLHLTAAAAEFVDAELFTQVVDIQRAEGLVSEPFATLIAEEDLALEWEWERSPEISVAVVDDLRHALQLFNRYSPQFVISLISESQEEHDLVYRDANAPFVGDGFTRWVDGQYALLSPELGLSNWEGGRLLGRSAILSGDSVHTVRVRARISDQDLRR
jgi:glutamate-5-semialdehyde dehydrogenase